MVYLESEERKICIKTRSRRAGLKFPARRIHRILKRGNFFSRIATSASIYVTAVLEYLSAEILELSGSACEKNNRVRILPRHIILAIQNDDELNHLLDKIMISQDPIVCRKLMKPKKNILIHKSTLSVNNSSNIIIRLLKVMNESSICLM